MNNDNDLLELNDGNHDAADTINTKKEALSINLLGVIIVLGFLVVIGMIFLKNASNNHISRDVILLRQVELLNILKTSRNQQEMQYVVNEYDSLALILEQIDNR
ncbi:MAG: hypothetical protein ACRBFS_08760 [Aureispira sp.]